MPPLQTQDILDWYTTDTPPPARAKLLVKRATGGGVEWALMDSSDPWPDGAFQWAALPV